MKKLKKHLTMPKKLKGTLWGYFFFVKNIPQCRKTQMWDPLISPGIVCYAEKKGKTFLILSARQNGSI